jgi:hypothetical protein
LAHKAHATALRAPPYGFASRRNRVTKGLAKPADIELIEKAANAIGKRLDIHLA